MAARYGRDSAIATLSDPVRAGADNGAGVDSQGRPGRLVVEENFPIYDIWI